MYTLHTAGCSCSLFNRCENFRTDFRFAFNDIITEPKSIQFNGKTSGFMKIMTAFRACFRTKILLEKLPSWLWNWLVGIFGDQRPKYIITMILILSMAIYFHIRKVFRFQWVVRFFYPANNNGIGNQLKWISYCCLNCGFHIISVFVFTVSTLETRAQCLCEDIATTPGALTMS